MHAIDSPTETKERPPQEPSQVCVQTSSVGRYQDITLAVALVGPLALIGLLTLLGLGFALAVCAVFAAVFVITTVQDATWVWHRHMDREDRWDLD